MSRRSRSSCFFSSIQKQKQASAHKMLATKHPHDSERDRQYEKEREREIKRETARWRGKSREMTGSQQEFRQSLNEFSTAPKIMRHILVLPGVFEWWHSHKGGWRRQCKWLLFCHIEIWHLNIYLRQLVTFYSLWKPRLDLTICVSLSGFSGAVGLMFEMLSGWFPHGGAEDARGVLFFLFKASVLNNLCHAFT